MNEPVLLDVPRLSPGRCICGSGADQPVIDTNVELIGYGRVYLCAKTCAVQVAALIGHFSPDHVARLHGVVDELAEANEKAANEVAHLKANLSVPLAEVIDFMEERAKRRPNEAVPAA